MAQWNSQLPKTKADWDSKLSCESGYGTWTPDVGANERKPINCLSWYMAFAFCIYDGGFLPSAAEWEYAARGGSQQRKYPWGNQVPDENFAVYDCNWPTAGGTCVGSVNIAPVGSRPLGIGPFSHADLAGNVQEWTLDKSGFSIPASCTDCVSETTSNYRIGFGGGFDGDGAYLLSHSRDSLLPADRLPLMGARCARVP